MDCPSGLVPDGSGPEVILLDRGSGFDTALPIEQWNDGPSITWISVGRDANGDCVLPAGGPSSGIDLSAKGCRLIFESTATNLIAGMTIQKSQIYLWERSTLEVVLVSHEPGDPALPGDEASSDAAISDDGRWVVFRSFARNLTAQVEDDVDEEVFAVDLDTRPFTAVRIDLSVNQANIADYDSGGFRGPYISPNGRWISLSTSISEYRDFTNPLLVNPTLMDTLLHDRDANGDGTWGDDVTMYLHLEDPAIGGSLPYGNGWTVPHIRFTRALGPLGSQHQFVISTTIADNLNQNLSPADTNATLPRCTDPRCGDDIYQRVLWEQ